MLLPFLLIPDCASHDEVAHWLHSFYGLSCKCKQKLCVYKVALEHFNKTSCSALIRTITLVRSNTREGGGGNNKRKMIPTFFGAGRCMAKIWNQYFKVVCTVDLRVWCVCVCVCVLGGGGPQIFKIYDKS